MKLGEALTLRKKQAEKLNDLRGRIKANVLVQEGQNAQEDPKALLSTYDSVSDEHRKLVLAINLTNAATKLNGVDRKADTLLELISIRENLIRKRNTLTLAAQAAQPDASAYRYMRSELSYVPQVSVSILRESADEVSQEITRIDVQIQEINWQTDLVSV